MTASAHLEYFLLGSSLLDVLFRQKLLQAAKAITTGAEMNVASTAATFIRHPFKTVVLLMGCTTYSKNPGLCLCSI